MHDDTTIQSPKKRTYVFAGTMATGCVSMCLFLLILYVMYKNSTKNKNSTENITDKAISRLERNSTVNISDTAISELERYGGVFFMFKILIILVMFAGLFVGPMITYRDTGRLPMLAGGPYTRAASPVSVGLDNTFRVMIAIFFLGVCILLFIPNAHESPRVRDLGRIGCIIGLIASLYSVYAIWGPSYAECQMGLAI